MSLIIDIVDTKQVEEGTYIHAGTCLVIGKPINRHIQVGKTIDVIVMWMLS